MYTTRVNTIKRDADAGHDVVVLVTVAEFEVVVEEGVDPAVEMRLHARAYQAAVATGIRAGKLDALGAADVAGADSGSAFFASRIHAARSSGVRETLSAMSVGAAS